MASEQEHYFTARPAGPGETRTIEVTLAGRDLELLTAPGVFSADHLDHATRVLIDHVPEPPAAGTFLDLGCGWGALAIDLALRAPRARVLAVDVNERALALTAANAAAAGAPNVATLLPEDVPADLEFDLIWSNPPVRIGKPALHELLARWLPRLRPGACAYLVVGKNLGADSLARWLREELGAPTERIASAKGFRILKVARPA